MKHGQGCNTPRFHQPNLLLTTKTISRRRRPAKRVIKKRLRVNLQINVPEVMVIDDEGNQLGVMDTFKARQLASERELDLIEVSPLAQPPVCRIMNFGAYQYQQEKKERKQKSKQKKVEVKGIRLTLKIGPHDLDLRKNQAIKFLEKGNKVKVELILRGRERAHADRARQIMESFHKTLSEELILTSEQSIERQGNRLSMLLGKK